MPKDEYNGKWVDDEKIVDPGRSQDSTRSIKLNEIKNIKKKRFTIRGLVALFVLVLVGVFLGAEVLLSLGMIPSPTDVGALFAVFILIVGLILTAFSRDKYVIEGMNDAMTVTASGGKGEEFMYKIHRRARVEGTSDYSPKQEKRFNATVAVLVLIGVVAFSGVGMVTASDQVTWERVTAVVEAVQNGSDGQAQQTQQSAVGNGTTLVSCNTGSDLMVDVVNDGRNDDIDANISVRGEVLKTNGGIFSETTEANVSDGSSTLRLTGLENPEFSVGECVTVNATAFGLGEAANFSENLSADWQLNASFENVTVEETTGEG